MFRLDDGTLLLSGQEALEMLVVRDGLWMDHRVCPCRAVSLEPRLPSCPRNRGG